MKNLPPRLLVKFFRWYCHPRLADHIEGDLIEVYRKRLQTSSKRTADVRFMIDTLLLFRPGIIRPFGTQQSNRFGMYRNYLTMTFRVFNKERLYSLINVAGLATGFCCCLLIYLFVAHEWSYDRFHTDGDRIYRLSSAYMRQGQWEPYASNAWRTAELIKANYGEVELLTRLSTDNNTLFEYGEKRFVENSIAWVEDNFLTMFNFPLVAGNPADALKGPNKVVISQTVANRYFGTESPLGKVFLLSDYPIELQVSGVMKDMPANSHFHFDILISGETLRQVADENLFTSVGWDSQHVYVRLAPGTNAAAMEATFGAFIDKNLDFWKSTTFKLFLQPLQSIHLESNIGNEIEENGSLSRVYTFSVIAVFVLIIACVNYMNLTTARSLRRAKEVGMRKVIGAKRADLFGQFLVESFVMTTLATLLAIGMCFLLLPAFNNFSGKEISINMLFSARVILGLLVSLVAIALISGLYPAFILSSFKPLNSMKLSTSTGRGTAGLLFRRGLVLLQFMISIGLIAASAIVYNQWNFMRNKDLGINDQAILTVPLQTMERRSIGAFSSELLSDPSITRVGYSNMRLPGWIGNSIQYKAQDVSPDEEVNKTMKIVRIDYDFLSTIETELVDGRNFSRDFPGDTISSIILNEAALEQLRWTQAVGKWMEMGSRRFNVVGVVKDFHYESLHRKIPPIIFVFSPRAFNWAYVKVDNTNVTGAIGHIRTVYSKFVVNRDFSFSFLEDDIQRQYAAEQKFSEVFAVFTGLAILIACLGTFGLISFSAERKSKEIGIRKILGASTGNVSLLLMKEFVVLLLIASVIACPLTYFFLDNWVQSFIYRTSIGAVPFVIATVLAVLIVVLTTGFRALKAAWANPVESLRE